VLLISCASLCLQAALSAHLRGSEELCALLGRDLSLLEPAHFRSRVRSGDTVGDRMAPAASARMARGGEVALNPMHASLSVSDGDEREEGRERALEREVSALRLQVEQLQACLLSADSLRGGRSGLFGCCC
jgi:hypothetical protein